MGKARGKKSKESQKYSNDRLGRIAQEQIGIFAESAHLNKSASNPDLDGWDFHFSVPRTRPLDGSNFFDGDRPRSAMFVQVKGTIGTVRRRAVALSHWLHASTLPLPFYFVVVEFTAPPMPAHLFVIHVDQALVESVARRLRQEGAKARSKAPALNRLTMDLTWDESHEIACTPDALRDELVKHAGDDMAAYAAAKRLWWDNAGSTTTTNSVTLRFKGPKIESQQRLADWALGITANLHVDNMSRVESRWGIPRTYDSTDTLLSFTTPPSIGTSPVQITSRDGIEHVEFDADVFCNVCFVPHLPKDMWAIRLVWGTLQVIFRADSTAVTVQLAIPPNVRNLPLAELATAARAIRLLSSPCCLTYTVPRYGDNMSYTAELNRGDGDLFQADGELDVLAMLRGADAAWTICGLFHAPSAFAIHPGELEERAEELAQQLTVHTSDAVTVQVDIPNHEGLTVGEPAAFLWFPVLELGDYLFISAAVVRGPVEFVGMHGRITARPSFARRWVIERRHLQTWQSGQFPRHVYNLTRDLESPGEKLCLIASPAVAEAVNALSDTDKARIELSISKQGSHA